MSTETMSDTERERELLTRKANQIRSRLEDTLDQLDQKKNAAVETEHEVVHDVKEVVRTLSLKDPRHAAVAVGGAALALATGIGVAVHRAAHRDERLRRERIRAVQRLWEHPERAFQAPRSIWAELGKTIVVGALSLLTLELLRNTRQGKRFLARF